MTEEIKNTENTTTNENNDRPNDRYDDTRRPRRDRESFENKGPRGGARGRSAKKKLCRFCAENIPVDYKNIKVIKSFITERYKIVPGRITGTCARHQRQLTVAVKRARHLSLIPYTTAHYK